MKNHTLKLVLITVAVLLVVSVCGIAIAYAINDTPCNHELSITVPAVAPTCEQPGHTEAKKCAICGEIFDYEELPALGHDPEELGGVKPTFVAAGRSPSKQCKRCDKVLDPGEVLPALKLKSVSAVFEPGDYKIYVNTSFEKLKTFLNITALSDTGETMEVSADNYTLTTESGATAFAVANRGTTVTMIAAYTGSELGEPDELKNFTFSCQLQSVLLVKIGAIFHGDETTFYATSTAEETAAALEQINCYLDVYGYYSPTGRLPGTRADKPFDKDEYTLSVKEHADYLLPGENTIQIHNHGNVTSITITCVAPEGYVYPEGYEPSEETGE